MRVIFVYIVRVRQLSENFVETHLCSKLRVIYIFILSALSRFCFFQFCAIILRGWRASCIPPAAAAPAPARYWCVVYCFYAQPVAQPRDRSTLWGL